MRLRDVLLVALAAGLLLAAGIRIGYDVARINALAAEEAPVRVITKGAAWELVYPRYPGRMQVLRVRGRGELRR